MKNFDTHLIDEDINLSDEETELLVAELRKLNPCNNSNLDDE